MTDNDIYRYIVCLHDNPKTIVITKSVLFKPDKKAWTYRIDGGDELLITEDDINNHKEQLRVLGF